MHRTTGSRTTNQCSTDDALVKQEIVDEHVISYNESSSSASCQAALKCEFDPDCGCKQCQFNKSRNIHSGALQIKLECDDDKTKVTIKTEFVTKCVKNEIKEEDYCGCNECFGVGSSNQYDQEGQAQIETDLPVNGESVQPPTNDYQIINQDYDDIRDCPTPDYLPPFFSEDEDEEEESEDEVNQPHSPPSEPVDNKPQNINRYEYSENKRGCSEYESSEDENIDGEETELNRNILNTCNSNADFLKENRSAFHNTITSRKSFNSQRGDNQVNQMARSSPKPIINLSTNPSSFKRTCSISSLVSHCDSDLSSSVSNTGELKTLVKREQNRQAAKRLREKKRFQKNQCLDEIAQWTTKVEEKRQIVTVLESEIAILKDFYKQICQK